MLVGFVHRVPTMYMGMPAAISMMQMLLSYGLRYRVRVRMARLITSRKMGSAKGS